jgi:hypothetical protein
VRTLTEQIGYSRDGVVIAQSASEIRTALVKLGLSEDLAFDGLLPSAFGESLIEYFAYRAKVLNTKVKRHLMTAEEAKKRFQKRFDKYKPNCPIPSNKQKGDKSGPAYMTGLVNMLIEKHLGGRDCNYNPQKLTTITRDGLPVRTLARRVDGAFPGTLNPVAIWEIKEYYYTSTFGSRIADGVYESLLDGMELEELRVEKGIDVKHYLMVDGRDAWWDDGKSYLCRLIDMLHMGHADEVLFGKEVETRLPKIVPTWITALEARAKEPR